MEYFKITWPMDQITQALSSAIRLNQKKLLVMKVLSQSILDGKIKVTWPLSEEANEKIEQLIELQPIVYKFIERCILEVDAVLSEQTFN